MFQANRVYCFWKGLEKCWFLAQKTIFYKIVDFFEAPAEEANLGYCFRNLAQKANNLVIEKMKQEEEWENVPEVDIIFIFLIDDRIELNSA